jgi:cation/acetate symporter
MALYTLSLMIGTAGLPHVIIRFFTVPKVADARWSAGWALVFIALLYLTAPAVGAMARLNITDHDVARRCEGEAVAVEDRCPIGSKPGRSPAFWVRRQERRRPHPVLQRRVAAMAGLAADGAGEGNELSTFNRDILVLANPEIASCRAG